MNQQDYRRAIDSIPMDPGMKGRIQSKVCPADGALCAPIPRKRQPWKRIAAVAGAATLITALLVPAACGYGNVVEMVADWSQEQFWFKAEEPDLEKSSILVLPMDENGELDLETWLTENHVRENLLNMELPDGFSLVESDLYPDAILNEVEYVLFYKNADNFIALSAYQRSPETQTVYEKDKREMECYLSGDVEHYIFYNLENITAVWHMGNLEYSISTSLSMNELKACIDSIYKE